MELGEIRRLLLEQHAGLRQLLAELEAEAQRVVAGTSEDGAPLLAKVQALVAAVAQHHETEDAHLGGFLPDADAWGAERLKILRTQHDTAHDALTRALAAAESPELAHAKRAEAALSLARDLYEHMRIEERYVLSEALLRDDAITIEFGG